MESKAGESIVASKMGTGSTDLVVVNGDEYALVEVGKTRRAHICCGCDTRNAVIVVNSIGAAFYTLMVASFSLLATETVQYDDDQVQKVMDTLDHAKMGLAIATSAIGLICTIVAIYGAAHFQMSATGVGGIWFAFEAIRSLVFFDIVGAAIAVGFCYPHAVLYHELKNGVLTKENYQEEKICCDCCCTC